ncbi:kinesin-domain-containing protein [Microthyrium microscopicum]|uniref:Kinesin-domain-containing protein n=1 Tax=Microthyrium microscopicum TaxID=703497 RepID=A0A6A6U873_9PEZI|nr:kinesin-domain-containing protein [Microthyrium microscopicum]
MATSMSPPTSPIATTMQRPKSAMIRPVTRPRSQSRMSASSRQGASTRSDEDNKHTAVRVAVRVRPPLKSSDPGYDLVPQRFRGSRCQVTSNTSLTIDSQQGKRLFVFDRVFGEDVDQDGVWEYLSESVNSFVQGYNVSVLAYGQSGAGKSYTMGTTGPGEQSDARLMGIVPRAAAALFEKLSPAPKTGIRHPNRYSLNAMSALSSHSNKAEKDWKMTATYVEIYQEQLRDLLVDESIPYNERPQVSIREDSKGRILLTGLKQVTINSIDDLLSALNFGSSIRQTDATAVNARSSRSHAVFSLNLVQKKGQVTTTPKDKRRSVPLEVMSGSENWITVDSKLHFVDLAGSERLKNTQAHGERAKEGISINAGLASLGKVISQLSSRSVGTHISYRDSRLTRLLQDSLGGKAITYMVACVNPAEFHLSETLNTVQYAQRARAIQLKPQIQQVHDDSDKQATIERLRAEVQFLRDQIRLSERSGRRTDAPQERLERVNEREIELQNQLLDVQENYTALSQRHAKVISEIAKARDSPSRSDGSAISDATGNSAMDRLKKSSDFAEAVEQVVLEYEKTIQSLEASLSNTRSSLSNSESTLLEKETKIAYMETVSQQLQSRLQKAMDREQNDDNYLHELESRVAGANTDEEKSMALVTSLKKELSRVRESEAGAEDYISTLEERLAEAEQQHDIMSREIDRLEHVVERQRSIKKLDNLLYELDHIRQNDASNGLLPTSRDPAPAQPITNGHSRHPEDSSFDTIAEGESIEHIDELEGQSHTKSPTHSRAIDSLGGAVQEPVDAQNDSEASRAPLQINSSKSISHDADEQPSSPAQSRFVNDKLETVTQELFDLRMEHENTVGSFDELQRKYQVALTTMAELQDALEDTRHGNMSRPISFMQTADGHQVPKRTLSAELEQAEDAQNVAESAESAEGAEQSEAKEAVSEDASEPWEVVDEPVDITNHHEKSTEVAEVPSVSPTNVLSRSAIVASSSSGSSTELEEEMTKLRKLHEEKESVVAELKESYSQLHDKHQDTLDYVEALKAEVQKASSMTGRSSPNPNMLRRKAERTSVLSDRANRSFAALRNMALDNFEEEPEKLQTFETNISSAMTEFHLRTERVQQLESELGALRKEMEAKTALINGLTRERSSLKASPIDMTALSTLEIQLRESESQIRSLSESHATREQEMTYQIEQLKLSMAATTTSKHSSVPGTYFDSDDSTADNRDSMLSEDHHRQVSQLQKEVADWRSKHDSAMESMKASEKQLLATISDLQVKARDAEEAASRSVSPHDTNEFTVERQQLEANIASLQRELEEHKSAAGLNAERLAELEDSYNKILSQVEDDARSKELTEKELSTHRNLVSNLEGQLDAHKSAISSHQEALEALRDTHSKDLDSVKAEVITVQTESNDKLTAAIAEHQQATTALQSELETTRSTMDSSKQALEAELSSTQERLSNLIADTALILNKPTNYDNLTAHIQALVNARKDIGALHETATTELKSVREELDTLRTANSESDRKFNELKMINEETLKELQALGEKEQKSSRLVQELEDQLNSNFDQTQAANNRLSAIQVERHEALQTAITARSDLERELEDAKGRIGQLESELTEQRRALRDSQHGPDLQRSNSESGPAGLRKSVSPVNLPSPPPAIPLPPLPGAPSMTPNLNSSQTSPPSSRHTSRDVAAAASAQLVEDQEARIRTIEKHLFAEKQLTATLEEALTDLESSSTKMKTEMELWRRKCATQDEELNLLRKEKQNTRLSVQQMEMEAQKRINEERQKLEERMAQLNNMSKKQKKKSSINCF